MCFIDTNSSEEHIQEIKDNELCLVKQKQFEADLNSSQRFLLLKEAFPNLSLFLFCHNDKIYDFDTHIEQTHFGVNVTYENTTAEIRCYSDHNTIKIKDKMEEFKTIEEVIAYVKNHTI